MDEERLLRLLHSLVILIPIEKIQANLVGQRVCERNFYRETIRCGPGSGDSVARVACERLFVRNRTTVG